MLVDLNERKSAKTIGLCILDVSKIIAIRKDYASFIWYISWFVTTMDGKGILWLFYVCSQN